MNSWCAVARASVERNRSTRSCFLLLALTSALMPTCSTVTIEDDQSRWHSTLAGRKYCSLKNYCRDQSHASSRDQDAVSSVVQFLFFARSMTEKVRKELNV